jgi:hypothetical protein
MLKGFAHARLACGCRLAFRAASRDTAASSPVVVVLDAKSNGCVNSRHVSGLPLYDYREAMRPSTRFNPAEEEEFEEEN